jgi:F-type H+-transporting ATPase subunit delta
MRGTKQAKRDAKQLFRLCLVNSSLDESRVRQVVHHVIAGGRRNYRKTLALFVRFVRLDRAQHTGNVESAMPLPPDVQAATQARLRRMYGPGLTTLFSDRPALIGGMRIQVGSDVYDGSVLAGLAALERS